MDDQTSQPATGKSLQDCKDEIAQKVAQLNWDELRYKTHSELLEEVATLYATQKTAQLQEENEMLREVQAIAKLDKLQLKGCVNILSDAYEASAAYQLYGYVFEDRFYKSLEELSGMTMYEGNKPVEVYTVNK